MYSLYFFLIRNRIKKNVYKKINFGKFNKKNGTFVSKLPENEIFRKNFYKKNLFLFFIICRKIKKNCLTIFDVIKRLVNIF